MSMSMSVQFSRSVVSDSLQLHGLQHARLPSPSPTPGVHSNLSIKLVMPSNHLILCQPLLLPPSILPSIRVFSNESLSQMSSLHQVAKVLEFQLQHQSLQWIFRADFLQDGLVGSSCSPRDSQESSPVQNHQFFGAHLLAVQGTLKSLLQFKTISSLVLIFLYSPTLTPIHDHWKNHSFD